VVAAREERIDERALPVAGRGVDHEAGGLVDDQQVLVLVDDRHGDGRVGLQMVRDLGRRNLEGHAGAAADLRVRPEAPAGVVDQAPIRDQLLDVRARQARPVRDEPVDPSDDLALRHGEPAGPRLDRRLAGAVGHDDAAVRVELVLGVELVISHPAPTRRAPGPPPSRSAARSPS
jgi:hypothetical protein